MKLDPKSKYDDGLGDLLRAAEMAGRGKLGVAKYMLEGYFRKTGMREDYCWNEPKIAAEKMMDKFFELVGKR